MDRIATLPAIFFIALLSSNHSIAESLGDQMATYFPENSLSRGIIEVNWSQPPLGCVEEMIPSAPTTCLDLSGVEYPNHEWPSNLTPEEKKYWYSHRRFMSVCRAQEILRREAALPGSQAPGAVALSWMVRESTKNAAVKVNTAYEASRIYGVPAQVLVGSIYQESLFVQMGISDDGGNFSCGLQQINATGWCEWANLQSDSEKKKMNWPLEQVNCLDTTRVGATYIKAFYNIALTKLNGLPLYRMNKSHFANIPLERVVSSWPVADLRLQFQRYQLAKSFIDNCSDARNGIMAKAHQLKILYNRHVSSAFKNKEHYPAGEKFKRNCRAPVTDIYPLHTGWLLAVAAYNAGPRAIEAVGHYNGWNSQKFNDPEIIKGFYPDQIIQGLYWGGAYNRLTDKIDFNGWNSNTRNWIWYKACVVQRHIARVIQHVTLLPEFFVNSLEGENTCAKSIFQDGKLVQTSVPLLRQRSSGYR